MERNYTSRLKCVIFHICFCLSGVCFNIFLFHTFVLNPFNRFFFVFDFMLVLFIMINTIIIIIIVIVIVIIIIILIIVISLFSSSPHPPISLSFFYSQLIYITASRALPCPLKSHPLTLFISLSFYLSLFLFLLPSYHLSYIDYEESLHSTAVSAILP